MHLTLDSRAASSELDSISLSDGFNSFFGGLFSSLKEHTVDDDIFNIRDLNLNNQKIILKGNSLGIFLLNWF